MIQDSGGRTYRSFVLVFLGVLGLSFLVFTVAIFGLIKPLVTIRSTVEIGSFVLEGSERNVIMSDSVVKLVTGEYIPAALSAMERKGIPPAVIDALNASTVDSTGRSLMITSAIHPAAEAEAREFQQDVIGRILRKEANDRESLRQRLQFQIGISGKTVAGLRQEADAITKATDDIDGIVAAASRRSNKSPGGGSEPKGDDRLVPDSASSAQTEQRDIVELALERARFARLLAMTRSRMRVYDLAIARLQYSLKSIREATVSQEPQSGPGPLNAQRFNLLFLALVISILLAIVAAAVFRDFEGTSGAETISRRRHDAAEA